jgi:quercetin dioxygenase-like cupin family protein
MTNSIAEIHYELPTKTIAAAFASPGAELVLTPRDRFSIKVDSEDTQGACTVIEYEALPGAGYPLHIHTREDETIFVLTGAICIRVGDKQRELCSGEYAFLPRGILHGWYVLGNAPARLILTLTPGGMEQIFVEMNELVREEGAEFLATPEGWEAWLRILSAYGVTFFTYEDFAP